MMAALGSTQQQMTSSSSFEKEVEKEEDLHLAADPVPPYMNGHLKESNTKSIRTSPTRAVQSNQHNNDNRGITNTRSRVSSSSLSGESYDGLWEEEKDQQQDDVVGDIIVRMLNEGKVPHFGYNRDSSNDAKNGTTIQSAISVDEAFKLYPLISARNFRALCNLIWNLLWKNRDKPAASSNDRLEQIIHPIRFLLEAFAAVYIVLYSVNDIVLRSISEMVVFTLVGTISTILFDMDEVKYVISLVTPAICIVLFEKCKTVSQNIFAFIERELLWGHNFDGRTFFLWSTESDSKRLLSFRRKHRRYVTAIKERRRNKKDRRKTKDEARRRGKRMKPLTQLEVEKMEAEIATKEKLDGTIKELSLNPPTFFPGKFNVEDDPDRSLRNDASNCHAEALHYCQQMILLQRDQEGKKLVSITATFNDKARVSSVSQSTPREAIEVVDSFPDINNSDSNDLQQLENNSVDTISDICSVDFNDDDSDYSSDDDNNGDDAASIGTYASDSTARSMPWLVVGAKIGHKLLSAKKLRRVIANPDAAQNLIPDEAKKLIDGMNNDTPIESPRSSPTRLFQDAVNDVITKNEVLNNISQSASNEVYETPKKPVHGMWTKAGAVAETRNSSYGAITLAVAPLEEQSISTPDLHDDSIGLSHKLAEVALPQPAPAIEMEVSDSSSPVVKCMPQCPPIHYGTIPLEANVNGGSISLLNDTVAHSILTTRLAPIERGVKMVVPMFPPNCRTNAVRTSGSCFYNMGTVMSSQRIYVGSNETLDKSSKRKRTNCLSIKVIMDKALLRGGKFVEMNLRIMDEWNYIPRHSKFAIGSCVATTFGVGVLVGWRVEDDMHIIGSLWKRSGSGSGLAYLRRDSVHSVVEAAVGFDVQTIYGAGKVMAYVRGGELNNAGIYLVSLYSYGSRKKDRMKELNRCQILSCEGPTFVPITEHIRAAALYRLEVINYKSKLREQMLKSNGVRNKGMWRNFSEYVDLFANSLSKAIAEDPDFESEFDKFISHFIRLIDGEKDNDEKEVVDEVSVDTTNSPAAEEESQQVTQKRWNPWNDIIGCFFEPTCKEESKVVPQEKEDNMVHAKAFEDTLKSAEIIIRVLLKTVAVAKGSVPDRPKLHIALAMIQESLLLVRQVFRVQLRHMSKELIEAWFRSIDEISDTFGPLRKRTALLWKRMERKFKRHGNVAKRRILHFVDVVLSDTQLLHALELGNWSKAMSRFEMAIVKAEITDASTCDQLHKGAVMMYKNLAPRKRDGKTHAAVVRNKIKAANFAKLVKMIATPGRSLIKLLTNDDVLVLFDRVLVRVFEKDPLCSMVINIYAFNFESVRHLRTLNNMSIAGKLWETVLDAIDEEINFATGDIPEQTKRFIEPFVKLFSLGVAQFHIIQRGGSNADWLDFLMEDDAVKIIQELDYKLIDFLNGFCSDIKQVVQVLPYIKTIDDDILNLMDEFDFDVFLKEISDIIGDSEKSMAYISEKSVILVERFLVSQQLN